MQVRDLELHGPLDTPEFGVRCLGETMLSWREVAPAMVIISRSDKGTICSPNRCVNQVALQEIMCEERVSLTSLQR
jgi:hypothetical protein